MMTSMKFLLITPPLTQLNTPYPATAVLKGWLQAQGYEAVQADLGIETVDRLFTGCVLLPADGTGSICWRRPRWWSP